MKMHLAMSHNPSSGALCSEKHISNTFRFTSLHAVSRSLATRFIMLRANSLYAARFVNL